MEAISPPRPQRGGKDAAAGIREAGCIALHIVRKRRIAIGEILHAKTERHGGIAPLVGAASDEVIVAGIDGLSDGMPVRTVAQVDVYTGAKATPAGAAADAHAPSADKK